MCEHSIFPPEKMVHLSETKLNALYATLWSQSEKIVMLEMALGRASESLREAAAKTKTKTKTKKKKKAWFLFFLRQ